MKVWWPQFKVLGNTLVGRSQGTPVPSVEPDRNWLGKELLPGGGVTLQAAQLGAGELSCPHGAICTMSAGLEASGMLCHPS